MIIIYNQLSPIGGYKEDIMFDSLKAINIKFTDNKESIKTILTLAFPIIIENILQILLGTADSYFVSKLDSTAIAGIGLTNLIMNIYISFFLAIGVGTTAVVSRYYGMNNFRKTVDAIKQSIILSVIISISLGIFSLLFSKHIFYLLGADNNLMLYTIPYFKAVAVPSVFLSLLMILSSSLRGIGDTKSPMIAVGISCILNIVLDYFFIFGFLDFKGFGILGAGIATTLSRFVAVIILLIRFNNKSKITIKINDRWKIDRKMIKTISKIGIPAGLEKLFMRIGQLSYNSFIISFGTTSYVAHNIAGTIDSYTYLPAMGFGVAAATLVGQNLGANNPDKAMKCGLISYVLSTILMMIMGIFIFILAPNLVKIFTNDIEIISLSVYVLRIIVFVQPFLAITMVIASALQGAGDTKYPMYLTLIGIWTFRVGLGYILSNIFGLGLIGIWLALSFDIAIRGIVLLRRFIKGKWKNINVT